jgi:SpoVK/Ycf46/Vps4 family AAA+-type ATPase
MHNALRDNALTKEDIPEIAKAKYELLNKDDVLYYEHNTSSFAQVGGQKNLKEWLDKRKAIFLGDKKFSSNDIPKGILLLGVQGSGKSLAAKSVAGTWGIPLLRLDFGTLYNKYYGETERKTRDSMKMADMMSPCVLWIDEIEKGIAPDSGESGTSKRILGTLLTWMAERTSRVFVVATANDIQCLPPELLRKGRLDEIFFVDLPNGDTRKEIFSIHLKKREFNPGDFNLESISEKSNGFSGAEIEQVIVSGLYSTIGGSGNLNTDILLDEIKRTKPLSVIMAENIESMREWAKERTVPAN